MILRYTDSYNELMKARAVVAVIYEWEKWCKEIPYISFPPDWEVKAIPPYGGAIIRYLIRLKADPIIICSIYLDCYGELGHCTEPYWEVYPYNEDCYRCPMGDTQSLLDAIRHSLGAENDKQG